MKENTKTLLDALAATDWFLRVGQFTAETNVKTVGTWQEALLCCRSQQWENTTLEARNALTRRLASEWTSEYQNWNLLVRE